MTVTIQRRALLAHPAEHVFDLIEAAEHYPDFLPWCVGATIIERDEQVVVARLTAAWHGLRFSFVTRNPKRRPTWMAIGLEEGPFRHFEGTWQLTPLTDWGCRVEFALAYEFNASLLDPLAGPMFQRATGSLVDAFVRRADQCAGQTNGRAAMPPPVTVAAPRPVAPSAASAGAVTPSTAPGSAGWPARPAPPEAPGPSGTSPIPAPADSPIPPLPFPKEPLP